MTRLIAFTLVRHRFKKIWRQVTFFSFLKKNVVCVNVIMRAYPLVVLESAPITTPPSNSTAIVVVYKWVKKQYFIIQKFNVPFGKLIHVWVTDCWIEKRNFFFHFNHYSGVQYSGVVRQPQKIVWLVPSNLPLSSIWYLVDKPGNFTVYIFFGNSFASLKPYL